MSNARKLRSSVAPMNTRPDAVTIGPPRLGDPDAGMSGMIWPSGEFHRTAPVPRFTATSEPNGGLVQGRPLGARKSRRRITYGVPFIVVNCQSYRGDSLLYDAR